MNDDKTTSEPLDYLAFEYVSGEMTAEQAAKFEDRLSEDQMAREAVASVVELSMAIARVVAEPVSVTAGSLLEGSHVESQRRGIWPTVWMPAVAAACLAAVVFWQGLGSTPIDSSDTPSEVETGLAQIWADTLSDEFSLTSLDAQSDAPLDHGESPDVSDISSPVDANEEPLAPDWLMAALADEPEVNVDMNDVDPTPEGS